MYVIGIYKDDRAMSNSIKAPHGFRKTNPSPIRSLSLLPSPMPAAAA